MKTTLISHFYNEEFLLPHWIEHHKPMFDNVVMINYKSTDRSVEIIRDMAPDWKIVNSCNMFFDEPHIGHEVERIETEFNGWKIVLNTTEFLFHPDIRSYAESLEHKNKIGIRTNGVILVDRPEERSIVQKPLCLTKTFGYMESDVLIKPSTTGYASRSRSRLFHRNRSGLYRAGRHDNHVTNEIDNEFILLWFGWAPFDKVKYRKLQIQHKVSIQQKINDPAWARLYVIDEQKLEKMFFQETSRSYNLLEHPIYKQAYDRYLHHNIL